MAADKALNSNPSPAAGTRDLEPTLLRYFGVEAARGVAAAMVAMHHAARMTAEPRYYGIMPFHDLTANFGAGVDFFFVLSGFIIATTHWSDLGRPDRLPRYIQKRFLRIYPIYWTVLLPLSIIYFSVPSFGDAHNHDPAVLFPSFTLLPLSTNLILGVAWTLQFEIVFYIVFAIAIFRRAWGISLAVCWFATILTAILLFPDLPFPLSFFLNARILEFAFGVLAALLVRRFQIPAPTMLFVLGSVAFITSLLSVGVQSGPRSEAIFTGTFGIASLAILLGLVGMEKQGRIPKLPLFAAMGACSYAIYLIHVVAESAFERPAMQFRHVLSAEAAALVLAAVGVIAGIALHYAVEVRVNPAAREVLQYLLKRFGRSTPAASVPSNPEAAS